MTFMSRLLGLCAALALLALTAITFADVVGRCVFSAPLSGASEVISVLLALTIFAALPAVTLSGGHITVDLVESWLTPGANRLRGLLVRLVSVGALALLASVLYRQSVRQAGMMLETPHLGIPYAPVMLALSALTAAAALLFALDLLRRLRTGRRP